MSLYFEVVSHITETPGSRRMFCRGEGLTTNSGVRPCDISMSSGLINLLLQMLQLFTFLIVCIIVERLRTQLHCVQSTGWWWLVCLTTMTRTTTSTWTLLSWMTWSVMTTCSQYWRRRHVTCVTSSYYKTLMTTADCH